MKKKDNYKPELVYYDGSDIPSINVPKGKDMPMRLFVFGCFQTGETEPGPQGEEVPIIDIEAHQYFSYNALKEGFDPKVVDQIREYFGLQDLKKATKSGERILEAVKDGVSKTKGN